MQVKVKEFRNLSFFCKIGGLTILVSRNISESASKLSRILLYHQDFNLNWFYDQKSPMNNDEYTSPSFQALE